MSSPWCITDVNLPNFGYVPHFTGYKGTVTLLDHHVTM